LQFADLFHLDGSGVIQTLRDGQVSLLHFGNLLTQSAFATWLTWSRWLGTIERLGKTDRQATPANAGSATQQVSMPDIILCDMFL
jgi:hypothetical protein